MKKAAKLPSNETPENNKQIENRQKFRLIKNENWQPTSKPKQKIKLIIDELPPAAA
jgi:hypothetical protein